ncbi:MGMT family protein [Glaciecola siphonariae]|uniref:MGMT family protein n=1 Tax=Glaciecola siphonariae TaxID=521012 RepID=A0ABV9LUK0_9ALTE
MQSAKQAKQAKHAQHAAIFKVVNLIPEGKVASYGQIADLAGLPGRARLVGKALSMAPEEITDKTADSAPEQKPLNWHRVLRANGQIAFAKGSEQAKEQIGLLQQENVAVFNHRVNIKEFGWQPDMHTLLHDLSF